MFLRQLILIAFLCINVNLSSQNSELKPQEPKHLAPQETLLQQYTTKIKTFVQQHKLIVIGGAAATAIIIATAIGIGLRRPGSNNSGPKLSGSILNKNPKEPSTPVRTPSPVRETDFPSPSPQVLQSLQSLQVVECQSTTSKAFDLTLHKGFVAIKAAINESRKVSCEGISGKTIRTEAIIEKEKPRGEYLTLSGLFRLEGDALLFFDDQQEPPAASWRIIEPVFNLSNAESKAELIRYLKAKKSIHTFNKSVDTKIKINISTILTTITVKLSDNELQILQKNYGGGYTEIE